MALEGGKDKAHQSMFLLLAELLEDGIQEDVEKASQNDTLEWFEVFIYFEYILVLYGTKSDYGSFINYHCYHRENSEQDG